MIFISCVFKTTVHIHSFNISNYKKKLHCIDPPWCEGGRAKTTLAPTLSCNGKNHIPRGPQ